LIWTAGGTLFTILCVGVAALVAFSLARIDPIVAEQNRGAQTASRIADAVLEHGDGLLLVCNQRRNGSLDWSTPGGVIDATDASILDGLTREVEEETGLVVQEWEGPLYEVTMVALDLGWIMHCEVHRALSFEGNLRVDDPDGIVVDAAFFPVEEVPGRLEACFHWVREPLAEWLRDRWEPAQRRGFSYDVRGTALDSLEVIRTQDS
jgi:8-oxo-dGTP pyrophosphatase MutT (NUDIX family)